MNVYHTQRGTYYKASERKDGNDAMLVGPHEFLLNALPDDASEMVWSDVQLVIDRAKRTRETLSSLGLSEDAVDDPRVREIVRSEMQLPVNGERE